MFIVVGWPLLLTAPEVFNLSSAINIELLAEFYSAGTSAILFAYSGNAPV